MTGEDTAPRNRLDRSTPEIRELSEDEVAATVPVFTAAFQTYPSFVGMFPNERLRPVFVKAFMTTAVRDALALGICHGAFLEDRLVGVAAWIGPGGMPLPWQREVRALPRLVAAMARQPHRLRIALQASAALDENHPAGSEHWYLATIGVHPDAQGRGVGTALLDAMHTRFDERGEPAFLETSKPSNAAFYVRHGYVIRNEGPAFPNGPIQYYQWRDPIRRG